MRLEHHAVALLVKLGSCSCCIRNRLVGPAEPVVWAAEPLLVSPMGRKAGQAVVRMAEVASLDFALVDRVIAVACDLRMPEVARVLKAAAAAAGNLVCLGVGHGLRVTVH